MRRHWSRTIGFAFTLLAGAATGQTIEPSHYPRPDGPLTVWVIGAPGTVRPKLAVIGLNQQTPITYQEQNAGSFGQTASSYGGVSSATGVAPSSPSLDAPPSGTGYHEQTSGSFGQASSETGTAASNHGQTASTLGQTASTYGTAASSHGQTAGSYGHSLSTIAGAGTPAGVVPARTPLDPFETELVRALPTLRVKYVSVDADDLRDRLMAAEGTADYPDLLIGFLSAVWWNEMQAQFGVTLLMSATVYEDHVSYRTGLPEHLPARYALMLRAPHRATARAVVFWMNEGKDCMGCVFRLAPKTPETPGDVLARNALKAGQEAVERMAHGIGLGDLADPAMAEFSPRFGWAMVPVAVDGDNVHVADDAPVRVEPTGMQMLPRLAIASFRVVTSSDRVFGVSHPMVVLRRGDDGAWRVLHLALNLPIYQQRTELDTLFNVRPTRTAEAALGPKGISQAVPLDGDARSPLPDLWWDNLGGAGLQAVEWQTQAVPSGWTDAHLFLVRDFDPHLQTRVRADFASQPTTYRWRVWSVGAEGEMVISPWRTLRIMP